MSAKLKLTMDTSGIGRYTKNTRRGLGRVVIEAASAIQAHAQESIRDGDKTGRIYELGETEVSFDIAGGERVSFTANKGKAAKQHQASAPGESPANETDNLADSIHTVVTGELSAETVVGAAYGLPLEEGTDDGRLEPRPFIEPAVEHVRPQFVADVADVLKRGG
jgi:hypothetical protein